MNSTDTISYEDIKSGAEKMRSDFGFGSPFTWHSGLRIFEEPKPPAKLRLSTHIQVSDEFRKDFDLWLAARFGYRDTTLRDRFYVCKNLGVIVAPHGAADLLRVSAT